MVLYGFKVVDPSERIMGKRKLVANPMPQLAKPGELNPAKKQKPPAYFVPELAHIVALCDERLPFALITTEVCQQEYKLLKKVQVLKTVSL